MKLSKEALAEFRRLHALFKQKGVETILIKSIFTFPYQSDNLDILIKKKKISLAQNILRKERYVELKNVEEYGKFLFRRVENCKTLLAVHLHYIVGWNSIFFTDKFLWKNLRKDTEFNEFIIPSIEASIMIHLAHEIYEDKRIKEETLCELSLLIRNNLVDWEGMSNEACINGWSDGFIIGLTIVKHFMEGKGFLLPDKLTEVEKRVPKELDFFARLIVPRILRTFNGGTGKINFFFSKYLNFRKLLLDKKFSLPRRFLHLYTNTIWGIGLKLKKKCWFFFQPSFLVSFSGFDGSGKTTQIKLLQKVSKEFDVHTRVIWIRYASSKPVIFLIKLKKRLEIIRKDRLQQKKSQIERKRYYLNSRKNSILWQFISVVELLLFSLKIYFFKKAGYVILFDRYLLDAISEMEFYSGSSYAYAKFLHILLPEVDVSLNLDIRLANYMKRNVDFPELQEKGEDFTKLHDIYQKYAIFLKTVNIDGNDTKEKINEEIVFLVFSKYFADFSTPLRRLFLSISPLLNQDVSDPSWKDE